MIKIDAQIYAALIAEQSLSEVETKIYPCVAEQSTDYPFIVFARTAREDDGSKDGRTFSATVVLDIVDDDHDRSTNLAAGADDAMMSLFSDTSFTEITLTSCDEKYQEGAYIQTLVYNLTKK